MFEFSNVHPRPADSIRMVEPFASGMALSPPPAASAGKQPVSGRPIDRKRFPGPEGPGRAWESVYHHLLNCGLRVAPGAGSGAGATIGGRSVATPLGANRVYVQAGEHCTWDAWLTGLRSGHVTATNGPLLRTRVEGEPPGHVFALEAGESREFQIALDLAFYAATQVMDHLRAISKPLGVMLPALRSP